MIATSLPENITYNLTRQEVKQFNEEGFLGPFPLFEKKELFTLLNKCSAHIPNQFLPNILARHSVVKTMARIGSQEAIVRKIIPLLGHDLLLWGSQLIIQKPMKRHRFHRDAEFAQMEGVAVWIALKNVVPEETFSLITKSHLFPLSPQELEFKEGLNICDEVEVLNAAQQINLKSKLVTLNIKDGEFMLFNGKLWHGTKNINNQKRYALNFRYARPESKIRISRDGNLPNVKWEKNLPLCLLVHGQDNTGINKIKSEQNISWYKGFFTGLFFYFPLNVIKKIKLLIFNK